MCEFGYVLTDENFKVIKKDDIPMSPGKGKNGGFHLRDRMKREDIHLAYEESFYFNCEEFPHHYEYIKKLLTELDTICFAFSAKNDILYLYHSCKRYNLEPFDYICYDVQKIGDRYLNSSQQINLKRMFISIVGPNSVIKYQEHLSRDDANMTADILEAICILENKNSSQLLQESRYSKYSALKLCKKCEASLLSKKLKADAQKIYKAEADRNSEKIELEQYKGKRYNLSEELKKDPKCVQKIIDAIKENGDIIVSSVKNTDVFVALDKKDEEKVKEHINNHFNGTYVLLDDLSKIKI